MVTPTSTPSTRSRRLARLGGGLTAVALTAGLAGVVAPASAVPADGDGQSRSGDRAEFVEVKTVRKHIPRERFAAPVIERKDKSMPAGQTEVVRPGRPGIRDVVYVLTLEDGRVVHRFIKRQDVLRNPRPKVVRVGTKAVVWDRLAECESGGNWHINTGNGYYGGLQFSLSTWRAYGGTGLPSQHSRETQIRIATKLRNASGGYGAWPACAAKLGLPR